MTVEKNTITLRLHGPFSIIGADGETIRVGSVKQKIILALLATAPEGKRSRSYIENMLWSLTGREQAQGNLRQALMALRRLLNTQDEILCANQSSVWIERSAFSLLGSPDSGEFLEGLNLPHEKGYSEWVAEHRKKQHQSSLIDASNLLRPTIAVLPFKCFCLSDTNRTISDMVAESLIHTLARSKLINVISHLSTSHFNSPLDSLEQVRDALQADYVVTGRIHVLNDDIRLQLETTHCKTGQIGSSDEANFNLQDFLNLGSDALVEICAGIGRSLFSSSVNHTKQARLSDVASHDLMMVGIFQMHRQNLRWFSEARERLEEVARRVPNSSLPQAWLAKWYILSILQGWSDHTEKDHVAKAKDHADQALQLNPTCSFAHTIDGFVHNNLLKNHDTAMSRFDEALALEPSNPLSWLLKGTLLAFMNEGEQAVTATRRARQLSPLDPHTYFYDSLSATAALSNQDYDEALNLADRSLAANKNHVSTQRVRTIALQRLGRESEARAAAETIQRLDHGFTIKKYLHNHPAANFLTGQDWADALREAGIREA